MRPRRKQEGIVMLVVMMVLLMGTVGATIAMDASVNGLRAAGHGRTAVQTKYMAEATLLSAVAYVDVIEGQGFMVEFVEGWAATAPVMSPYGEPEVVITPPGMGVNAGQHHAARLYDAAICGRLQTGAGEGPPVQVAIPVADPDPDPITGCQPDQDDRTGTMGPGNGWEPQRFVVDITDCQKVTTPIPGDDLGTTAESLRCVLTARGRTAVAAAPSETWTMPGSERDYAQSTHQAAHDAQMVIITPEIPSTGGNGDT